MVVQMIQRESVSRPYARKKSATRCPWRSIERSSFPMSIHSQAAYVESRARMRIVEIDECRRHSINEDAVARARISVARDFMRLSQRAIEGFVMQLTQQARSCDQL